MANYDQMTRDLAHKAGDDVCAAIDRTMALHPAMDSKIMIALMASGQAMAIPAALLAARLGADPETVCDVLWSRVKPIILSALGDVEKRDHG